ncbi:hypothetical protein KI811_02840 [Geobacter hydrogenophilus]|uniref:Type IV pili system adhesin PilY n=1 Tax=Geobacter hydrogenophilus TaxID=40983 RepID=A0A9W6G1F8_9BACT|nr:PilC/PilY family type IV pilus protein [Geobacter hydrogenophilus]MBT0892761.1 hypothetical protein [Geobacter hydrogenophilus]GLI38766.1 type IV pili system adhesin PilY [Geobacter hydrogenophilus]
MKRLLAAVVLAIGSLAPALALAAPDQYLGDLSIYGAPSAVQPNVLLIIDNSGSMQDKVPGEAYDPNILYSGTRATNAVYKGGDKNSTTYYISDVNNVTTSCGGTDPKFLLTTFGAYRGRSLSSTGSCATKGSGTYYRGNYLNYLDYLKQNKTTTRAKIDIAKDVVKQIIATTSGVKFGVMVFKYSGGTGQGGQFLNETIPGTPKDFKYVSTVKEMDAPTYIDPITKIPSPITNRTALISAVGSISPQGNTPLGETLFEARRYFRGEGSAFGNDAALTNGKFTSPVEYPCQKNIIIFVTDGMSNSDNDPALKTLCNNGDCDGDGIEPRDLNHILDDVAYDLYHRDLRPDLPPYKKKEQYVTTYTIGFGLDGSDTDAVALLSRTADSNHGGGEYYNTNSQQELTDAISSIIIEMLSTDTSIAAPVAAVSPENRTYGSGRVFMGFFKPAEEGAFWGGNLKKYGVLSGNNPAIIDVSGNFATYVDENDDHFDDNTNATLPVDAINGTFRATAKSYWSTDVDGSKTDEGGVGQLLQAKQAASRTIYTVTPTGTSRVEFNATNITSTMLGVTDTPTQTDLINFIRGQDVYDDNTNGNRTENRLWTMGDVIHSKPLVVNYATYPFNATNEADCSKNNSIIYVGSNDGMLHAFRDCNGQELWGFIPPTMLENLKFLKDQNHSYFVDSTPVAYIHDVNRDGTIDPTKGDKVILIFGTRRGGGAASTKSRGAYFALDVSIPSDPKFLWKIVSNPTVTSGIVATTGFEELAESWSEPKLVRMKIGGAEKIVAVIGAGYDNVNEDSRYGATQRFTGTGTVTSSDSGDGAVTSSGTSAPKNPTGRGIYLIEVGTLAAGSLNLAASGQKIYSFTYNSTAAPYSSMTFSFPSEIAAIDVNNNGYTSRLYAGDTGGNIWRFDVGDPDKTKWTARKLFSSNPTLTGDTGRKIFSKPSVVSEYGYKMLFFGTGDREHPLNTAIVDRIYALIDRDQTFTATESNLMDVTTDQLQTTTIASGAGSIKDILNTLNDSGNYGWYIKLNQNSGEKVLSSPLVFNKVAYFTTHTPGTVVITDPCEAPGNLGTGRIYALDYKTGEAVLNYDRTNDSSTTTNKRAKGEDGILLRSDRVMTLGQGIPSSPGVILPPGGGGKLMIGEGGALATGKTTPGGGIIPLYWRQK